MMKDGENPLREIKSSRLYKEYCWRRKP